MAGQFVPDMPLCPRPKTNARKRPHCTLTSSTHVTPCATAEMGPPPSEAYACDAMVPTQPRNQR
eukprot:128538-Rhodomonas_salina.3